MWVVMVMLLMFIILKRVGCDTYMNALLLREDKLILMVSHSFLS